MGAGLFDELVDEIDIETRGDDVGLWRIAWYLREECPEPDSVKRRLIAARVCRALLQRGVSLGQFTADREFVAWSSEWAVDRVLIEWSDLGRDPDIGEVAWFRWTH